MKNLLMVANVDWFFISHRLCIAVEAIKNGWTVSVAAEDTGRSDEITVHGIIFINFPFSRSGINPLKEFQTIFNFYKLYKKIQPTIVHHITFKPVIYGTVIAKLLKIHGVLNAVSGLGYNFTEGRSGLVSKAMLGILRYGLKRKNVAIIFQNNEDYQELLNLKVLAEGNKINFIKGSGVDLDLFFPKQFAGEKTVILLPTRLLWDKGVAEVRVASEILKAKYHDKISFVIAGLADEGNKAGVSAKYLNDWQDGIYVNWIGYQKNMVAIYQNCNIVILPSYREGMPRTLIEACAVGKPIVTTNAIGCRECVDDGVNGFVVPVKSTTELAIAIKKLVDNKSLSNEMGQQSRIKAINEFDVKFVVKKHLQIYQQLLNN